MLCIIEDPNQAICPNFSGPQWEYVRQSMISAHQGDQPLTPEEATHQMKDAWTCKNEPVIAAWNPQLKQDQLEQVKCERAAHKEEAHLCAQQDREVEELHWKIEKKQPKLTTFDQSDAGAVWIGPRLAQYALNLEYVKHDYFMIKGCREAKANERNLVAQRPTRCIRKDEELSWEEMLDAKNMMLLFMEKSSVWPVLHAEAISGFFLNLKLHPRKPLPNGKKSPTALPESCLPPLV
ncbi:hypothetical protein EI94DRAFT_1705040 [Lactarius quietus]|nr:hypothetical protein EI94DRAFT_1705040 [Lactarius quietus]